VTFEYCDEKKSVLIKTFRFHKKQLERGIKYINVENIKDFKLTNFLEIQSENYLKTSKKLIENDSAYVIQIPDFYKSCLKEN